MNKYALGAFAVLAAAFLTTAGFFVGQKNPGKLSDLSLNLDVPGLTDLKNNNPKTQSGLLAFNSAAEFSQYLEDSQSAVGFGYGRGGGAPEAVALNSASDLGLAQKDSFALTPSFAPQAQEPERYSQTNTQVLSIDEPDIVKTDGKHLFLSVENPIYYFQNPELYIDELYPSETGIRAPYPKPQLKTQILEAFPPEGLKKLGSVDKQGELLLSENTLMVFSYEGITAFDVADKANPKETWKLKYEQNGQLVSARLYKEKLYLVTRTYPDFQTPCPLRPVSLSGEKLEIACGQIYHPIYPLSDSSVFAVLSVNPKTGKSENQTAFVGSYGQSVAYMSENNLYITYTLQQDQVKIFMKFLDEEGKTFFPAELVTKIRKLNSYDLSQNAKMVELQNLIYSYQRGADQDELLKKQNELENLAQKFIQNHVRELTETGIAKISLDNFKIQKTASVPGVPLNQFSLDEYKGSLRIAVTIGQNGFFWGGWSQNQNSVNDVYVLDKDLDISGSVTDLGKGETVQSARFVGPRGYVVTFRQTDPFYVLDLTNAKNPKVTGELKIPGFSSYLHPLTEDVILGVGQENGKVKLSLFNVANPSQPTEVDKFLLNEYWSEAQSNHHAFLQDEKHQIFFLPGGQGGYVFGYKNGKLNLEKAIAGNQVKRAVYIDDYLYIVSAEKVTVYNENNWNKAGELEY